MAKARIAAERGYLEDGAVLLEGLRLGGVGVWRWTVEGTALAWTANLESVHGLPAGSFDGTLASFEADIHPEDRERVWAAIRASVETGAPYRAVYRTARGAPEPRWIEAAGGLGAGPGGVRQLTGICQDVTARVRGEQELQRRLRQNQAIVAMGSFALAENDLQRVLDRAAATAAEALDAPLTKVLQVADAADHLVLRAGVGWAPGLVGRATVGTDTESEAGYTLLAGAPVLVADLATETRFSGSELLRSHGVRSGLSVAVPGSDARPFGVIGVHRTEARAFDTADVEFLVSLANIVAASARQHVAELQQKLLMREMAHRSGNLVQLVSTIANRSFGGDAEHGPGLRAFQERLAALTRANQLISRGGWQATRLRAVLAETLQPFRDRLTLEGRDVLLPSDLCFDLSLVVHELATNSAKYGTLGRSQGKVSLSWRLTAAADGRTFGFTWEDPVSREVAGQGFGSRLIGALIERKWGGTVRVEGEAGYRLTFEIPRLEAPSA